MPTIASNCAAGNIFDGKLSKKNMELYVNISEPEKLNSEDDMPTVERKVIKLNSNIPEDEDFGI